MVLLERKIQVQAHITLLFRSRTGHVNLVTSILDKPYEFDYLVKDRPYNEQRYKIFIGNAKLFLI
jgi:hypothetical protein